MIILPKPLSAQKNKDEVLSGDEEEEVCNLRGVLNF